MYEKCVGLWLKTEGKRLFARPRHSWEEDIKMNLQ
jgi:hypothetical protein